MEARKHNDKCMKCAFFHTCKKTSLICVSRELNKLIPWFETLSLCIFFLPRFPHWTDLKRQDFDLLMVFRRFSYLWAFKPVCVFSQCGPYVAFQRVPDTARFFKCVMFSLGRKRTPNEQTDWKMLKTCKMKRPRYFQKNRSARLPNLITKP